MYIFIFDSHIRKHPLHIDEYAEGVIQTSELIMFKIYFPRHFFTALSFSIAFHRLTHRMHPQQQQQQLIYKIIIL